MTDLPADRLLAHAAWLNGLARRLVGGDLAADLQQDVALAALARPHPEAGRSWLAAVAHNLATSVLRRRSAEQRRAAALPPREPVPTPAELVATAELQQRAVAAVLRLPEVYRDTLLLRFMQGLSQHATAVAMGVPEETVRTRQKRALALLRAQLAPPRPERRSALAVLLPIATWSAVVNAKQIAVGAAVVLFAALVTIPLLRPTSPSLAPVREVAAGAAAHADPVERGESASERPGGVDPGERIRVAGAAPELPSVASTAEVIVAVRAPDDTPIAGFAIVCHRHDDGDQVVRSGSTASDGTLRFVELPPGRYIVTTMQYGSEWIELAAGATEQVAFTSKPGFAVRGTVLDAAGQPVAGASIWTTCGGVAPAWTFPAGESGRDGRFEIAACQGLMSVGASAQRYGVSDCVLLEAQRHAGEQPEEVVLRLDPRVTNVRGRVVDSNGRAIAGAWIELGSMSARFDRDADGRLWSRPAPAVRASDAEGRFEIALARVDSPPLIVTHAGFAPHREDLAMDERFAREVTVVLRPGGTLTGTVRDEAGTAVAGAEIRKPYVDGLVAAVTTGADGTFTLRDLPIGECKVRVEADDWPAQERTFAFAGGDTQTWDVRLAKGLCIHGRLLDARGAPLVEWWPKLRGADRSSKTDADGRFTVYDCEPTGNELVVRDHWGFVPVIARFADVAANTADVDFVVPDAAMPSARVRGTCVGPDAAPLADVAFDCQQDGRPVLLHNEVLRGNTDGTFDLGPLPAGHYTLTPQHLHCTFAPLEVELVANEAHDAGVLRGVAR